MSPEHLPIASVRAGGTNMQDQRELRGTPGQGLPVCAFLSDLPEQAGGGSLHQVSKDLGAPGRQSGDAVEWARPHSTLPPLDGEARISGDSFEGLSTSTARGPDPGEHSGAWGEFEGFRESSASSEQFSKSFELRERPSASQPWRTASAQKEHCSSQPHQGGVTGTGAITPSESLSGSPGRTLGEPGLHEPEELGFRLQRCRALIQTKLSGTPGGGQGSLITYSLFLKTPVHGNGQYITIPRKKKIFSPRNLKLTLFNSDIC
ncbi:hypothetical protein G4228_009676 [Cervus hanglu yarkandensis]|nr:hypothetical protein G4228_009676 [Cervus hanglu yarkandensis]